MNDKEVLESTSTKSEHRHDERELPLSGWRQATVLLCLFLGLFLSVLDSSIVGTALVTISHDFGHFDQSGWVISSYLLTYMGFAIVFGQLSDIFGRKWTVMIAFLLFTTFSIGCGASQSMTQLIICRCFQGIGASGLYSLAMTSLPEMVRPAQFGSMSAGIGITLGCAGILGPILGGAISDGNGSWRWIFLLNIPCGCLAMVLLALSWRGPRTNDNTALAYRTIFGIDYVGAVLLLAAAVLLVFALQQAARSTDEWNSATIIACLTVSAACWLFFVAWEIFVTKKLAKSLRSIFPVEVVKQRVMFATMVVTFITGFANFVPIVIIPQRSQLINTTSPLRSSLPLLPLLGLSAIGGFLGGALSSKHNLTRYTILPGTAFQTLGLGLLSTLPTSNTKTHIPAPLYGYTMLLGFGVGMTLSTVTIVTASQAPPTFLGASQGVCAQARALGGSIGVTVAAIILNHKIDAGLRGFIPDRQRRMLHAVPTPASTFPKELQDKIRGVYAEAFNQQMRILTWIALAGFVMSFFLWQNNPPPVGVQRLAPPANEEDSVELDRAISENRSRKLEKA